MPEGDTLARIADVLGRVLVGQEITAARGRTAAQLGRLVGRRVESVESRGKHLLIDLCRCFSYASPAFKPSPATNYGLAASHTCFKAPRLGDEAID